MPGYLSALLTAGLFVAVALAALRWAGDPERMRASLEPTYRFYERRRKLVGFKSFDQYVRFQRRFARAFSYALLCLAVAIVLGLLVVAL